MTIVKTDSREHYALLQMFAVQMSGESPEHYLWLAVLGQAIADAHLCVSRNTVTREWVVDAHDFLRGERAEALCHRIGLDPAWVRAKVAIFARVSRPRRERRLVLDTRRLESRRRHRLLPLFDQSAAALRPMRLAAVDELALDLVRLGFRREVRFHPVRRWRFDFAHEALQIAVECDGGIWRRGGGAHSRPANIERDIEKHNHALLCGWLPLRVTPRMVRDGSAVRLVQEAMRWKEHLTGK